VPWVAISVLRDVASRLTHALGPRHGAGSRPSPLFDHLVGACVSVFKNWWCSRLRIKPDYVQANYDSNKSRREIQSRVDRHDQSSNCSGEREILNRSPLRSYFFKPLSMSILIACARVIFFLSSDKCHYRICRKTDFAGPALPIILFIGGYTTNAEFAALLT
jgi:hypothetical protein